MPGRRGVRAAQRIDPASAIAENIRRRVRALEIRARALLREQVVGEFRSAFRGRGLEFSQIRAYLPGDDVRFIDWNVTARRDAPYIKQFVEERQRAVLLLVDVSASEAFGSVGRSVRSYAVEVAGLLGYAAALSNDRVGAVAFTDRIEYTLPPKKGPRHVLRMLHDLLALQPQGAATDLTQALDYTGRVARRGSVIFVLSDFHSEGWDAALRRLGLRHDVVALAIRDPHEAALPSGGLLWLEDSESAGAILVDAGAAGRRFAAAAADQRTALAQRLRAAGIDSVMLTTDEEYLHKLVALFRARMHRQ
ncbi:MAG: DUF58 domain-containing protein [Dehalococcoidia bacterium]